MNKPPIINNKNIYKAFLVNKFEGWAAGKVRRMMGSLGEKIHKKNLETFLNENLLSSCINRGKIYII
jgi:hypothetical protein